MFVMRNNSVDLKEAEEEEGTFVRGYKTVITSSNRRKRQHFFYRTGSNNDDD